MLRQHLGTVSLSCLAAIAAMGGCDQDGYVLRQSGGWGGAAGTTSDDSSAGWGGDGGSAIVSCEPGIGTCDCTAGETCRCASDHGEHCEIVCENSSCAIQCSGPSCQGTCDKSCYFLCEPYSSCTFDCYGGCYVICQDYSVCNVFSWLEPSSVFCGIEAICDCPLDDNCKCDGLGCQGI